MDWAWNWRKTAYMNRQRDMIFTVPFITGGSSYYTESMHVAKQIFLNDSKIQTEKSLVQPSCYGVIM
ncbi:hypothetical protein QCA50_005010 [Cerrena zonata]|uniref:Uncharacterized protein n=1 Tax=Cerrena zonata TaxID=2478898 RepID=A0AAW0GDX7_9APHY